MTERCYDVVVVGARAAVAGLPGAGITDFEVLDPEVTSSVFDDDTATWTLSTGRGETCRARVVIAYELPSVPWTPNLLGRNDFRGVSFHAAAPDPDFDAADRRIAVIGADATAGRLVGPLTKSAESVKVFPFPPRRVMAKPPRARRYLRRQPELVTSPIDAVTASGIRTADGIRHEIDTIIYGTGFAVPAQFPDDTLRGARGLTLRQAWRDGMEPYFGIAVHGFPNYFMLSGPDLELALHRVVKCIKLGYGHTRIEVRRSSQQVFNERVHLRAPSPHPPTSAFDLSSVGEHDEGYDGVATLTVADTSQQVRVRLAGHIEPIDGQYHWQGTVFGHLSADLARARSVTLTVGERSAPARIVEATPQGTHSITGVGAPPFALADAAFGLAASRETRVG